MMNIDCSICNNSDGLQSNLSHKFLLIATLLPFSIFGGVLMVHLGLPSLLCISFPLLVQ